jgi:hypothetical protein
MHPNILLQLARTELHDRLHEAENRRLAASARGQANPGDPEAPREGSRPKGAVAHRRTFAARRAVARRRLA